MAGYCGISMRICSCIREAPQRPLSFNWDFPWAGNGFHMWHNIRDMGAQRDRGSAGGNTRALRRFGCNLFVPCT